MVSTLAHRLRPVAIGVAALILTAGVAFAGMPASSVDGLATASQAAGRTVPAATAGTPPTTTSDTIASKPVESPDTATERDSASANCTTDPTGLTPEQLAELTHGQIVCWAAHQPTPAGYANHGAWVSEWAKGSHGQGSNPSGPSSATTPDVSTPGSNDASGAANDHAPSRASGGLSHKP